MSTQIRDIYQNKLILAQKEDADAAEAYKTHKFFDDPKIQAGALVAREQAFAHKKAEAARYIVRLIDTTDLDALRKAVDPETLKEVLVRGGADVHA